MLMLLIGVAFGCNYTEDMTYGKYLYFFFFKPTKHILYESTEDVERMKKKAEELKKEEEMKLQRQKAADPEAQRKLLIKMVAFIVTLVVIVAGVMIYAGTKEETIGHHIATEAQE